jgi:hypothetical protein
MKVVAKFKFKVKATLVQDKIHFFFDKSDIDVKYEKQLKNRV